MTPTDWPSFVFGAMLGVISTVVWWLNSRARAWWREFEETRLRIKADGERIQKHVDKISGDIRRGARRTDHRFKTESE